MAFHLHRDGKAVEFALDELLRMARAGELREDEYVYDDVKGEWIGAALLPELEGAWSLEEEEATVAIQLPADFFEKFDEQDQEAQTGLDGPTRQDRQASREQATSEAHQAGHDSAHAEEPNEPVHDVEEATRAVDLAEFEGALAPSSSQQQEQPVAMESPLEEVVKPAPEQVPAAGRTATPRATPQRRPTPAAPAPKALNRPLGKSVSPVIAALLGFFTCGVYPMIWIWHRSQETNNFLGAKRLPQWVVPAIVAAVILFGGGLSIVTMGLGIILGFSFGQVIAAVWAYKLGKCINEMNKQSRLNAGDREIVYALCVLMPPALLFIAQSDLNEIWKANGAINK